MSKTTASELKTKGIEILDESLKDNRIIPLNIGSHIELY